MSDIVSLNIDKNLIQSALEKKIQAEIVAAVGEPEVLIGKVVAVALRQKVSNQGGVSSYSSDNKYDFIEILCQNSIKTMAIEAVKEWVSGNGDTIKKAVIKELQKPNTKTKIAESFANAIENSLKFSVHINCNVTMPKPD